MNRGDVYLVLADELEAWKRRGFQAALARVGQPAVARIERVGSEEITVCVCVRWNSEKRVTVRVEATADGPSCWRLERVEESLLLQPDESA
jgi:hypothetical protein